jgi:hypothetical protein
MEIEGIAPERMATSPESYDAAVITWPLVSR